MALPPSNLTLVELPPESLQPDRDQPPKQKPAKIRSAWISFASRILAQLIGAAATIGLGLVVMQQYAAPQGPLAVAVAAGPASGQRAVPLSGGSETAVPPALAVLPFTNLSTNRQHDVLADALTEALIANLTQGTEWRVISRTTSMQYKQSSLSLPAIARELNAGLVIEGSVTVDGDRMRAVVQLIDAATDHHLWARTYERPMGNLLDVEADIVSAVAWDLRNIALR